MSPQCCTTRRVTTEFTRGQVISGEGQGGSLVHYQGREDVTLCLLTRMSSGTRQVMSYSCNRTGGDRKNVSPNPILRGGGDPKIKMVRTPTHLEIKIFRKSINMKIMCFRKSPYMKINVFRKSTHFQQVDKSEVQDSEKVDGSNIYHIQNSTNANINISGSPQI